MNRVIRTPVGSALSKKRVIEEGLPQGSAVSCTLYLAFTPDVTEHVKGKMVMYADDMVIWESGKDVEKIAQNVWID